MSVVGSDKLSNTIEFAETLQFCSLEFTNLQSPVYLNMARWNLSLCCSPQPIARFMRLFPKLALIFLLVHVAAMIYSVLQPSPHALKSNVDKPPGVVDVKMRNIDPAEQHSDFKGLLNNGSEYNYKAEQKKVNSGRNDTKPGLLHRLNALKLKDRPET